MSQEVLNKIKAKSITQKILAGKYLLDYINFFSPNDKKNDASILKINMVEEASFEFRLRKINETKNYL